VVSFLIESVRGIFWVFIVFSLARARRRISRHKSCMSSLTASISSTRLSIFKEPERAGSWMAPWRAQARYSLSHVCSIAQIRNGGVAGTDSHRWNQRSVLFAVSCGCDRKMAKSRSVHLQVYLKRKGRLLVAVPNKAGRSQRTSSGLSGIMPNSANVVKLISQEGLYQHTRLKTMYSRTAVKSSTLQVMR
jgi:hypothetical protein